MKILLDENLPHRFRLVLTGHDVRTVRYAGWSGSRNGVLLDLAEGAGDQNLTYQQNLSGKRIAVITLTANQFPDISPHIEKIEEALAAAKPGSFQIVTCA